MFLLAALDVRKYETKPESAVALRNLQDNSLLQKSRTGGSESIKPNSLPCLSSTSHHYLFSMDCRCLSIPSTSHIADYTAILSINPDPVVDRNLHDQLFRFEKWFKKWGIRLNETKPQQITFTFRHTIFLSTESTKTLFFSQLLILFAICEFTASDLHSTQSNKSRRLENSKDYWTTN